MQIDPVHCQFASYLTWFKLILIPQQPGGYKRMGAYIYMLSTKSQIPVLPFGWLVGYFASNNFNTFIGSAL